MNSTHYTPLSQCQIIRILFMILIIYINIINGELTKQQKIENKNDNTILLSNILNKTTNDDLSSITREKNELNYLFENESKETTFGYEKSEDEFAKMKKTTKQWSSVYPIVLSVNNFLFFRI
jgi:hypothetical protein